MVPGLGDPGAPGVAVSHLKLGVVSVFCMRRLCVGSEGSRLRSGNSPGLRVGEAVRDRLESEWVSRLRSEMGGGCAWGPGSHLESGTVPGIEDGGLHLESKVASGVGVVGSCLGSEKRAWAGGGGKGVGRVGDRAWGRGPRAHGI